jgi:hypothetical protein
MKKEDLYINLEKAEISFKIFNTEYNFVVYHNLKKFGLLIDSALYNWVFRTTKFTEKSFCEYVTSKDPGIVCMPEKQYNRLFK